MLFSSYVSETKPSKLKEADKKFGKILQKVRNHSTGLFETQKILKLSDEEKDFVVDHLVRCRIAIVNHFIREERKSWLHSMGYLYIVTTKDYFLWAQSEMIPKIQNKIGQVFAS